MVNNIEPDGDEELPMFQSCGFVEKTGLAVVHEGEYIMPAFGSEAVIELLQAKTHSVVNYHFPVDVHVVGNLSEEHYAGIEARNWRNFGDALHRVT